MRERLWQVLIGGGVLAVVVAALLARMFQPNDPPAAEIVATPQRGNVPLMVTLDARQSRDPDGDGLTYLWSLPGGKVSTKGRLTQTFEKPGTYDVALTVSESTWWRWHKKQAPAVIHITALPPDEPDGPSKIDLYTSTDCSPPILVSFTPPGKRAMGNKHADRTRSIVVHGGYWVVHSHLEWNENPEMHGHGDEKMLTKGRYMQADLKEWGLDKTISSVKFIER